MAKVRITVTIDPDIEEWLRPEATASGKSLSMLIRTCLREYRQIAPNRFSKTSGIKSSTDEAWRRPKNEG
jgi:hypothetical protein